MTWILKGLALCMLGAFCSLSLTTHAHSQDIFSQLDQLREQLSTLQQEVSNLKAMVYSLEKQVTTPATTPNQPRTETKPEKQLTGPEKEQAKTRACKAGEKFLAAVDAVLTLNDESEAEKKMDQAMAELRAEVKPYEDVKEISKFLSLAEALAWDTCTAVGLRSTVEGNEQFLEFIRQSKKRFWVFCGTK
jgi:hypothetical protein